MSLSFLISSQWLLAFLINIVLITCAQRTPLLTTRGWLHAATLGTILYGCLGLEGWLYVVIYLLFGYLVTKVGFEYKKSLGLAEGRGGRRGPENVWGSAFVGAILALMIAANMGDYSLLIIGFSASFSAKLADTFGSEIGKRWGNSAFLITNFKKVPVGTDGAISLEGTFASLFGSFLMTTSACALSLIPIGITFVVVFISGFLATLAESFIGAFFQERHSWLSNELVNGLQTFIGALLAMILSKALFL